MTIKGREKFRETNWKSFLEKLGNFWQNYD